MKVTIDDKQFEVAAEPADFWRWVAEGRYNAEWAILKGLLRPEHTFIDLGAWVGSHSLYASTIAKCVVAVEPDPVAHAILLQNLEALPGTHVHRIAITGHEGTVTLGSAFLGASTTRTNHDAGGGIGAWEDGHQFEIPCQTLRSFFKSEGPAFIKIDVEGSEESILQDIEFFAEHKPTVYLECHPFWWKNEQATWECIRKIGKLYKQTLNLQMKPVDLDNSYPRGVLWPS